LSLRKRKAGCFSCGFLSVTALIRPLLPKQSNRLGEGEGMRKKNRRRRRNKRKRMKRMKKAQQLLEKLLGGGKK